MSISVSVLFSEPKIPQFALYVRLVAYMNVSVLFSEPKIPQSAPGRTQGCSRRTFQCSSASRKFLNCARRLRKSTRRKFQCSSASRKFLNLLAAMIRRGTLSRFSALQRAENSSIRHPEAVLMLRCRVSVLFSEPKIPQCPYFSKRTFVRLRFQCSSASRKFLNARFDDGGDAGTSVSVLFSEPKIPQSN